MLQRCENPKHPAYGYYGGSGVIVCERWHDFDNFYDDMGDPPPGLWLERKDNSKGYEPDNCCWVTPKQQAANRRKGGPKPNPNSLRQKSIRAGLSYSVVYQRILWGWTEERALSTPKAKRRSDTRYVAIRRTLSEMNQQLLAEAEAKAIAEQEKV